MRKKSGQLSERELQKIMGGMNLPKLARDRKNKTDKSDLVDEIANQLARDLCTVGGSGQRGAVSSYGIMPARAK